MNQSVTRPVAGDSLAPVNGPWNKGFKVGTPLGYYNGAVLEYRLKKSRQLLRVQLDNCVYSRGFNENRWTKLYQIPKDSWYKTLSEIDAEMREAGARLRWGRRYMKSIWKHPNTLK